MNDEFKLSLSYELTKEDALKLNKMVPGDKSMHEYISDLVVEHINLPLKTKHCTCSKCTGGVDVESYYKDE